MEDDGNDFLRKVEVVAEQDGRYAREAYLFIYAALDYVVKSLKRDRSQLPGGRHVTGQELSRGIADYARLQYGPLTGSVLEHWGIRGTIDFGHIVFNLVDAGLMSRTEDDCLEDFEDVYQFDQTFDPQLIPRGPEGFDLSRL